MSYYDGIAGGYNELHEEEQRKKLALIIPRLDGVKGTILDVGCGTGFSLDLINEATGNPCVGVEPSAGMIAQYAGAQDIVQAAAERLPFPDGQFCACVSVTAIQNFEDIPAGVEEMRRVTDGPIVISCLKRSPRIAFVTETISELLDVTEVIEEEKDLIFCCKRKN